MIPQIPELLAPGGDADCVKAAILGGANAVYLGLSRFNARMRASNISPADLGGLCQLAHRRGARLYVTLNVLLTETEIDDALLLASQALEAGADALIVQDIGLLDLLHRTWPSAELHASTQLTTHSASQLEWLAELGAKQVNLARELSLDEVALLARRAHELGMKVEVFVHGAYCISWSGQCYLSSHGTGLSGNRGTCVQPCRRRYDSRHGLPDYPLNMKDNNALHMARELCEAGVDSLKIEGRRKGFFYVWSAVAAWRDKLDALAGVSPGRRQEGLPQPDPASVFNRGFDTGWLEDQTGAAGFNESIDDASLEDFGVVGSYHADSARLGLEAAAPRLQVGDRLSVLEGDNFVASLVLTNKLSDFEFLVRIEGELRGKILRGQKIMRVPHRLDEEAVGAALRELVVEPVPMDFVASGKEGETLRLIASFAGPRGTSGTRFEASTESTMALTKAQKNGLDGERLAAQLGRLGDSPFCLGALNVSDLEPELFLPMSELNAMRRRLCDELAPSLHEERHFPVVTVPKRESRGALRLPPRSLVLVTDRGEDLVFAATPGVWVLLEGDLNAAYSERSGPWFSAIQLDDAAADLSRFAVIGTEHSGIALRAKGQSVPWIAGPRLNVTNSFSLSLCGSFGAAGACVSNELSGKQCRQISTDGARPMVQVYGPMLAFETRQCLVRGVKGCGKRHMDSACLETCEARGEIRDEQRRTWHLSKRKHAHNSMWSSEIRCVPDAFGTLEGWAFLADLRDPGFIQRERAATEALVTALIAACNGDKSSLIELTRALPHVGPGHWNRDLA